MPAALRDLPPADVAIEEAVTYAVPPAFYSDVPPPPPPPDDPHHREWLPQEPSPPARDSGEGMSDSRTMRWIMAVFGVAIALHIAAFAALVIVGHPG